MEPQQPGNWAIARLARPVTGIEPYRLPEQAEAGAPGMAVTTISESTDNWQEPNGMLAQNCHIIAVEARLAKQLVNDGHAEQTDALFLEVCRLLRDPAQSRPE